mmetsp:Transcript_12398/g.27863  ORF Transcript_12398/g.27863 Transcript_12398/m.27863 type:complete len:409 (+) Transcript_12398:486-1712(+)
MRPSSPTSSGSRWPTPWAAGSTRTWPARPTESLTKKAIGVLINRDLPDFERRFLHSIVLEDNEKDYHHHGDGSRENLTKYGSDCHEDYYDDHVHHLRAWRETTDDHRNNNMGRGSRTKRERAGESCDNKNNREVLETHITELQEIETNFLVDRIEPRQELLEIARDAGWDTEALRIWASALERKERMGLVSSDIGGGGGGVKQHERGEYDGNESIKDKHHNGQRQQLLQDLQLPSSYSSVAEVGFNMVLFVAITGLLLWGFFYWSGENHTDSVVAASYRAQFLSSLLSPLGTYSRWYLSRLNGSIQHERWEWLPIGTFLANMIASVVSALMAGLLLSPGDGMPPLVVAVVRAIQVGYAGSFSTVSTFATETTGLLRALPRAFWGYYYGFGSLACALLLGVISYAWAVV